MYLLWTTHCHEPVPFEAGQREPDTSCDVDQCQDGHQELDRAGAPDGHVDIVFKSAEQHINLKTQNRQEREFHHVP